MKKRNSKLNIEKLIQIILIMCIILGIILHIVPYIYNRSLWIDEVMLISSICTRSFSQLIASALDWGQSCAIGWLFIVKLITTIFGTSELTLRIWSLFTSFGCIALVYLLLKDKVKKNYALFITAIFSLTDKYIYYGNEAKPYMSDNLCCLIVLYLYQKYRDNKIKLWQMILSFTFLIWCSFPAVFFIAAIMIFECFKFIKELLKTKNKAIIGKLGLCSIVLISFILYYVFWLYPTSKNADGGLYWALLRFPLIPTSLSDIKLIFLMAWEFWNFYPILLAGFFCILIIMYIIYTYKKKHDSSQLIMAFLLSLLLLFVASFLGFYPIQNRLVQTYAIVGIIIAGYECDLIEKFLKTISKKNNSLKIIFYGFLIISIITIGIGGCKNFFAKHIYKSGSEIAKSIEYIKNNATKEDVIYVYRDAIPIYLHETGYKISYNDLKLLSKSEPNPKELLPNLPVQIDNIIYGQTLVDFYYEIPYSYAYGKNQNAVMEEADLITKNNSVYLFISHRKVGLEDLINVLEEKGNVEEVVNYYNTRLYHFTKNS